MRPIVLKAASAIAGLTIRQAKRCHTVAPVGASMSDEISRRSLLRNALAAATLMPALAFIGEEGRAADSGPLDEQDPAAKTFGFVADASKVDASTHSTFRPDQRCAVCSQYQGKTSDSAAGCSIFGGKVVPAGGWCKVWSQRSA
jgi:hypothetical protein